MSKLLLRVWHSQSGHMKTYPVQSVEGAKRLINELAESDLANNDVPWNAFGLEVFEDGEWSEWYDKNGDDICQIIDNE